MRANMRCRLVRWLVVPAFLGLVDVSAVGLSFGKVAEPIAATPESIVGWYEALSISPLKLLVLGIEGTDPGKVRLVQVAGPGKPDAIAFRATKFELDGRGRVVIQARGAGPGSGEAGSAFVELRLMARASSEDGYMEGTIAVWFGKRPPGLAGQPVLFRKTENGLVPWMVDARTKVDELLQRETKVEARTDMVSKPGSRATSPKAQAPKPDEGRTGD